jgi:multiple sugar transport system ATP-binding protein
LRRGRLQAFDTPVQLYERPTNLFVASFIGSPAMNLAEATLARGEGSAALDVLLGGFRLPVSGEALAARRALARYEGHTIVLGVRPEAFEDAALTGDRRGIRLPVVVELREDLGADTLVHFGLAAPAVGTRDQLEPRIGDGSSSTFVARLSPRTQARAGATIDLRLDSGALHFFDRQSGEAIYA